MACSDEQWLVQLASWTFGALAPDERLWNASAYVFRRRWKALWEVLWVDARAGPGLSPASLRREG